MQDHLLAWKWHKFKRSCQIYTPPAVDSVDDVLVGAVSNVRDGFFGFTMRVSIEYAANDARLDEVIGCTVVAMVQKLVWIVLLM